MQTAPVFRLSLKIFNWEKNVKLVLGQNLTLTPPFSNACHSGGGGNPTQRPEAVGYEPRPSITQGSESPGLFDSRFLPKSPSPLNHSFFISKLKGLRPIIRLLKLEPPFDPAILLWVFI